jgi:hypothetical protein
LLEWTLTFSLRFFHATAYQSSPAHIEIIVEEKGEEIVKEKEVAAPRLSKKQIAQSRSRTVKVGGGVETH